MIEIKSLEMQKTYDVYFPDATYIPYYRTNGPKRGKLAGMVIQQMARQGIRVILLENNEIPKSARKPVPKPVVVEVPVKEEPKVEVPVKEEPKVEVPTLTTGESDPLTSSVTDETQGVVYTEPGVYIDGINETSATSVVDDSVTTDPGATVVVQVDIEDELDAEDIEEVEEMPTEAISARDLATGLTKEDLNSMTKRQCMDYLTENYGIETFNVSKYNNTKIAWFKEYLQKAIDGEVIEFYR